MVEDTANLLRPQKVALAVPALDTPIRVTLQEDGQRLVEAV